MTEDRDEGVFAHRVRMRSGLRTFAADYTEFTRAFAEWLGLPARDATALVEVLYAEDAGTPLSPARLAERVGLTSGATTNLINRLEATGHVVRTREHADRRIVTLRYPPDDQEVARTFFAPLGDHLDAMLAQYPPEQLRAFESFLDHLATTMDEALADDPPPRA